MNRFLACSAFIFCLIATGFGQSSSPCTLSDHTEYTKKIKEFTTEHVLFHGTGGPSAAEFLCARA